MIEECATGTVEKYNPFTDMWSPMPSLPQRLRYAAGAVLHNQLYVLGGFNKTTNTASSAVYRYEFIAEQSKAAHMLSHDGFVESSSAAESGVGGYWNHIDIPLPVGRYTHAAVGFDGKIWVAGGFPKPNSVQVFDPLLGDWSEGPPLVVRRAQFKLLVVNGDLYAVGGDDATTLKTTIEKFNRLTQNWSIVTEFKEQRLMHSSTVAGSKIYIFGGMVSSQLALKSWDAYDVRNNRWDSDSREGEDDDYDVEVEDSGVGVGYDDDTEFDIDYEMTATPSTVVNNFTSGSRNGTPILPPIDTRATRIPIPIGSSSSSSSSPGFSRSPTPWQSNPNSVPSPSSNSVPSSPYVSGVVSSSPSHTPSVHGPIQLSVPITSSLKRSLSGNFSGSQYPSGLPLRSSSCQPNVGISPSRMACDVATTPSRSRSDGSAFYTDGIADTPRSSYLGPKAKKRRKKRVIQEIDRTIPFTHAFGCAVTIPAISFYTLA